MESFENSDKKIYEFKTKEDVDKRALNARNTFIKSIGGLPKEKCDLKSKTVGIIEQNNYRIEKIIYQSRPDFWIAANLYLPDNSEGKQLPAVLSPTGHTPQGKSVRWLQERAIGLVRKGYIVLTYDQVGLGERWMYRDPETGLSRIGNRMPSGQLDLKRMRTGLEHSYAGNQAWITGSSLAQHVVWDAIRGVDYLLTRPEVDPSKIACSGASMGGLATAYLTAVDSRLKASVPVSQITSRKWIVESMMRLDAEQILLGAYSQGLDHSDLLLPTILHNGYLQIISNIDDIFPIEGSRETASELDRYFGIAGLSSHFSFVQIKHGHGWSKEAYESLYAFLDKALLGIETAAKHTVTKKDALSPKKLWCTPKGNVTDSPLHSKTIYQLGCDRAKDFSEKRRLDNAKMTPQAIIEAAKQRTGVNRLPGEINFKKKGENDKGTIKIEDFIIETEKGIDLPSQLISKKDFSPNKAIIYVSPLGKESVFDPAQFQLDRYLSEGFAVFAVDVRGWGETRWRQQPDKAIPDNSVYSRPIYGGETILTYNSLLNAQTMVGQRAFDILAAVRWLKENSGLSVGNKPLSITLWGAGELAISALHAYSFAPDDIADIILNGGLFNYYDWACTEYYEVPVGLIVPGILENYDTGELVWAIGAIKKKNTIKWINPVDASNERIDENKFYGQLSKTLPIDVEGFKKLISIEVVH